MTAKEMENRFEAPGRFFFERFCLSLGLSRRMSMSRQAVAEMVRRIADDIENKPEKDPMSVGGLKLALAALTHDPRLELARRMMHEQRLYPAVKPVEDVWETGEID